MKKSTVVNRVRETSLAVLRALDDALRPQAAPAGGELVAQAVLFVGNEYVTATAEGRRRKSKALHFLAVADVYLILPDLLQVTVFTLATICRRMWRSLPCR